MPTYDYKCKNCGNSFDKLLKIKERFAPENEACPSCGNVGDVILYVSSPKIVSEVGSLLSKTSDGWKDRLKQIKKNNIRSTIKV